MRASKAECVEMSAQLEEMVKRNGLSWVLIELSNILKPELNNKESRSPEFYSVANRINAMRGLGYMMRELDYGERRS